MPFATPEFDAIQAALLRDIANQVPTASTGADSDFSIRANAVAAAIEGLYQHQAWLARQIFPDTADTDWMERHATLHGLTRKAAAAATGAINFTGLAGSAIPSGTQAANNGGVTLITTAAGTLDGSGLATVAGQAVVAGSAGNLAAGSALTLSAAPAGVQSAAIVATLSSGTDTESDAALLARLLDVIRQPPVGGNQYDYTRWALEVSGVTAAWCYPLRRGVGTVDVVITSNGAPASAPLIAAVQAHIDLLRPVTADFLSVTPTLVPVAITASLSLSGVYPATVTAQITASLAAYFATLIPGDTVYRNRIAALIQDQAGVVDFTLTEPAANVAMLVDTSAVQLASLGTVALS